MSEGVLTERFQKAFDFSLKLHGSQLRKDSNVPYMSHLLAASALVLENGGGEDEAIAALLHDAVEDQGGKDTLKKIEEQFGLIVSQIVIHCSDTLQTPKPPWKEIKQAYLSKLNQMPVSSRLVSLADKVHNARSILLDYHLNGDDLWERFRAGKYEVLWYYNAMLEKFKEIDDPSHRRLMIEFSMTIKELNRLTGYKI